MFTKFKTSLFALVFVISLAFTSQLTAVNTTLENPTLVGSKHMSIALVDQKKSLKKKSKSKKKKARKKRSRSRVRKKNSTVKKIKSKRKNAKRKRSRSRVRKKVSTTKKSRSKKVQKKNQQQRRRPQQQQQQRQPQQRQQRQQQLADVKRQIKTLKDELIHNFRSLHSENEQRSMLRGYYPRFTSLFIQKITVEAALNNRSIRNPWQEFYSIFGSLATILRDVPDTDDMDRTKQGLGLAIASLLDDDENVRQEAYDRLVRDYNDLLNGDVEGYINQAAMVVVYSIHHGLL